MGAFISPRGSLSIGVIMEEQFEIFEFKFIDKKTKMRAIVYARTEGTALKIINMWNDIQDIYFWVKLRFRFKKKCATSIPPYELEQEQIQTIQQWKQSALNG